MDENFDKIPQEEDNIAYKPKKSASEVIIKILTIACVIASVALVAVLVFAAVGKRNNSATPGNVTPDTVFSTDSLTTTENPSLSIPTSTNASTSTTASNQIIAYATEEVNVRTGPSTDYDILRTIPAGQSVIFVSKDENNWCKVMIDGEICYIYREYLTTKKPDVTTTQTAASATNRKIIDPTQERWYLVVVDRTRQMPEGYTPNTEYVADSECSLEARVAPYYDAMYKAALEDGVELTPYSGYRSYATQEYNFNSLTEDYLSDGTMTREEAEAEAAKEILPPGCSEHNLGLAMDICGTDDDFKYTDEYDWLQQHAHEYGFIERYTEDKQDITGIIPEPWHWRFVGVSHATKIKNAGICLEEYYQHYGVEY